MDFIDWLRDRDDAALRTLLSLRPELVTPVPADLAALANRASSPSALARSLDRLDRWTLTVLETIALDAKDRDLTTALDGIDPSAAIATLRALALVYDEPGRPAPGVQTALDRPAGLGPPARELFRGERLSELLADLGLADLDELVVRLRRPGDLIDEAGAEARTALERLAWGPPAGRVERARRPVSLATAASPIEALLARGLLAAENESTVVLPREVALWLRGGRIHRSLAAEPPPVEGDARDIERADRTAAGQAFIAVRAVEELGELWGGEPPDVLRAGGLGMRELKRTAQVLDVAEWIAALFIEVAHEAGLITAAEGGQWLPTPAYDLWLSRPTADRWAVLVSAWLAMPRLPGLIGERDDRGRALGPLHPGLRRGAAAAVRQATLTALAAAPPGIAPSPQAVAERLAWDRPRRVPEQRLIEFTLREAEQLGILGLGAMSSHGRSMDATTLAPRLPQPVDNVVLQADLTAVAPGPLTGELARLLGMAADVESTGGATVYRFSPESVRRALDAGHGAASLLSTLAAHSTTPVPQPLAYLIDDVARRHGRIRAGTASAYVRCDDPATLDELLADRRAVSLRLRRLAPTVLATRTARGPLLDSLRSMGFAPVAESLDGDLVVTRPDARRAPASPHVAPVSSGANGDMLAAAVRALRAGDEASMALRRPVAAPGGSPPQSSAAAMLVALREAIGRRVLIGYLDAQGHASSRIVEPARVEGGYLTAFDATKAAVHRFALHRITGVAFPNED